MYTKSFSFHNNIILLTYFFTKIYNIILLVINILCVLTFNLGLICEPLDCDPKFESLISKQTFCDIYILNDIRQQKFVVHYITSFRSLIKYYLK
jgi:hypothetical protein